MRAMLAFLLILSLASWTAAETYHVPADYFDIQLGMDAASAGDTVLVACGTHLAADEEAVRGLVGPLPPGVCLVQHDSRDPLALAEVGEGPLVESLLVEGLAVREDGYFRLTPTGLAVADAVAAEQHTHTTRAARRGE